MKAVVYHRYGAPDVLRCEETATPAPGEGEVLIRVRAAAANPMDAHLMKGAYLMRPMTGLRAPRAGRPGADLAGEVEAVGRNVTRFQPGDAVFGASRGTFAEYVCAREDRLAPRPANLSFEQAAALPVAGLTALQGLRDKARVGPGQKVLIHGAAGGVGTFAVQIARAWGAEVTGVCRTTNMDLVRSLGAHHVVDYTREDFTRSAPPYDVMLDCVGDRSFRDCRRALRPQGTYVAVGVRPGGRWLGPLPHLLTVLLSSRFVSQRVVFFVARVIAEDLAALKTLAETGKLMPVIGRRFPLTEAAEAIRYLGTGHPQGKVVITM